MTFILKAVLKKLGWRLAEAIYTAGISYLLEKYKEENSKEVKKN